MNPEYYTNIKKTVYCKVTDITTVTVICKPDKFQIDFCSNKKIVSATKHFISETYKNTPEFEFETAFSVVLNELSQL